MPAGWRRSLTWIAYFGCVFACSAIAVVHGHGAERAAMAGVVGGSALLGLFIGLAEIGFPAAVIRARNWLLAGQGPGFGQNLAAAFDRGLGLAGGGRLLALRALGVGLSLGGAGILTLLVRAGFL